MAKIIIEDGKIIELEDNKKKNNLGLFLGILVTYMLFKIASQHEAEIYRLKKSIKELKSKGE